MRREIPQKIDAQISPTDQVGFQSAARFSSSLFRRTRSASLLGVTLSASALGAVVHQQKAEAYLAVGPMIGTASSFPEFVHSENNQTSSNGISALLTGVSPQVANSIAPIQSDAWQAQETPGQSSQAVFSIAPRLIAGFQVNTKPETALTSVDSIPSSQQSLVDSSSTELLSNVVSEPASVTESSKSQVLTPEDAVLSAQQLVPNLKTSESVSLTTPLISNEPVTGAGLDRTATFQGQLTQEVALNPQNTALEKQDAVFHTVQKGENLTNIAHQYQVSPELIAAANQISDPNVIEVQSDLVIPVASASSEATPLLLGSWADNTKVVSKTVSQMGIASALLAPQRWPSIESASAQSSDTAQPLSQPQSLTEASRRSDKIPQAYWGSAQSSSAASESLTLNPRGIAVSAPYTSGSSPSIVARRSNFPSIPGLDLPSLVGADKFLPSMMGGGSQQYAWPAKGVFTSAYGWRWGRMHRGIDIAGPVGTPIVAAASGVVITAGWNDGGYGYVVEIQHPDGSFTRYAHNNTITTRVGAVVQQGEMIAEMGSTGRSTGPHCHFEIHPNGKGAVDPMMFLARS